MSEEGQLHEEGFASEEAASLEEPVEIFHQTPLWGEGGDLPGALEALFVAAGEVLDLPRLRELTGLADGALQQGVEKLQERLSGASGLRLMEVGGGWRMATSPLYQDMVAKLVTTTRSGKLTPAQVEALAIVAYRQPVTITELNAIRGVTSSANQIKSLMERQLITPAGRKPVVGRPMTYATTQAFLLHFGLKSLHDLPRLADFGEGRLEADALTTLEPPLPEDGLFGTEGQVLPEVEALSSLEEAPLDPEAQAALEAEALEALDAEIAEVEAAPEVAVEPTPEVPPTDEGQA